MGRGLSPLQRAVLTMAYANGVREGRFDEAGARAPHQGGADLYLWELLEARYGFGAAAYRRRHDGRALYEVDHRPHGGGVYYRDRDPEWHRRPQGSRFFSKAVVGPARYNAAHAAVGRALRRLEDRGLVVCLRAASTVWSGCSLTAAGRELAQELGATPAGD